MDRTYANALDDALNLFDFSEVAIVLESRIRDFLIMQYKFKEREAKLLIEKLVSDEMIEFDPKNMTKYSLTFKGKDFFKQGGYSQQEQDKRTELRYKNWTTFALIFGGIAAGIYYSVILLKWLGMLFHCYK